MLYAGPNGAVILRLDGGQLVARSFGADGTLRATSTVGAFPASSGNPMVGGSMTTTGATLIIWQVYGEADAKARWLAPDGTLATGTFPIAGWTDSAPFTAALAGGAVAIAAQVIYPTDPRPAPTPPVRSRSCSARTRTASTARSRRSWPEASSSSTEIRA